MFWTQDKYQILWGDPAAHRNNLSFILTEIWLCRGTVVCWKVILLHHSLCFLKYNFLLKNISLLLFSIKSSTFKTLKILPPTLVFALSLNTVFCVPCIFGEKYAYLCIFFSCFSLLCIQVLSQCLIGLLWNTKCLEAFFKY